MEQQPTCGQGLAQNAALPAKLAEVYAAVAENLEIHLTALDPENRKSRPEFDAYLALATEYRALESRARALAVQMEGCRDVPMAEHDMAVLTSQDAKQAFERLITAKRGLAVLVQDWVKQYSQMKQR
jgi:hypothetical protein